MRKAFPDHLPLHNGASVVFSFFTMFAAIQCQWFPGIRAVSLLAFAGLFLLYRWALPHITGRLGRFSVGAGAVFALCQSVGEMVKFARPLTEMPLLTVAFLPLYTALTCAGFVLLDSWEQRPASTPPASAPGKFFSWLLSGQKKSFFALWGVLALCWLPYFILFFPGLISIDTLNQMGMGLGFAGMSSHHPPVHSLWMGACLHLGKFLWGTYGAGVALAAASQGLLLALLCTAALSYMAKLSIAFGWRAATLALYALCPLFGWYAVTLWKDVWLAGFSFLFLLCCVDIIRQRAGFFKSPGRLFLLAVAVLGTLISKNNGVYFFAITALGLCLALKGARRQMAGVLAVGLVCSQLITGPFYSALGANRGSVREALSIPLLQVANVVRMAPDSIAPADQAAIARLLPYYDELPQRYNPNISDMVKDGFVDEVFAADRGGYFSLYLRLGLQHPKLYLRAALEHTYGYYCPDTNFAWACITPYPVFIRENADYIQENPALFGRPDPMTNQYAEPFFGLTQWLGANMGFERRIPVLGMLFSVGLYYWALLFGAFHAWQKRRYARLLALILPFSVWLTSLASPVNGEMRYSFPAVLATPFLLGYMLDSRSDKNIA